MFLLFNHPQHVERGGLRISSQRGYKMYKIGTEEVISDAVQDTRWGKMGNLPPPRIQIIYASILLEHF